MPEHGWSRTFLNKPGLLLCLNRTIYGWLSLEYAWVCLKYNAKKSYYRSMTPCYKLDSNLQNRGVFRTASNVQGWTLVKTFNMVLWIYRTVWICFVVGTCQGFEYANNTESFWIFVNMLLNNAWICLDMPEAEPRTEAELCKLSSTYRYIGAFRILWHI